MYLIGAKKTAKTSTASLLLAYRMFYNRNETYAVMSNSEHQSLLHVKSFLDLFSKSSLIADLKIYKNEIIHKNNNTQIKILPRTLSSVHGIQLLSVLVCDEIFEYTPKHFSQMDALIASQILAKNSQRFYLSNVAQYQDHKSLEILKYCKEDSSFYVKTFKSDKNVDWRSDKACRQANPMWSIYPHVRQQYKQDLKLALQDKDAEVRYKRFNLGLGCSLDDQRWVNPENLQWIASETRQKLILKNINLQYAAGFDVALSGSDSTSFCVCAKQKPTQSLDDYDSELYVLYYKITHGSLKRKGDLIKQRCFKWAKEGLINYQNLDSIDHIDVLNEFYKFFELYPHLIGKCISVFDPCLFHSLSAGAKQGRL